MHWCSYHGREEPETAFRQRNGGLDSYCIVGRREYNRGYGRKRYAAKKKVVAQRKAERDSRQTQVCTGPCGQKLPIEKFPLRSDRPGKRHARCLICRRQEIQVRNRAYGVENFEKVAEQKRRYHTNHPRYNDQSSRRRRANLNQIRHEPFTREQVRERDDNRCWFCKEPVDHTLKYPDPRSEVIHHIHPISKKGPNSLSNVALAHNRCNGRSKTDHTSPFGTDWCVRAIDRAVARTIVKTHHYLHRAPNTSFAFGLYHGDKLMGVVTFGSPSSWRITRSVCPENVRAVIELTRLWINDEAPFGAASWFVARALKRLPPLIVISYADTAVRDPRNGRAHDGGVYRALSFNYAGKSRPRTEWRLPGKSRNVGKDAPGAVKSPVSAKERYWTVTGNRRQKRILNTLCKWPRL